MPALSSYVDIFKNVRVLVIGDIMLDRFIYGNVTRISPEAPVPVVNISNERQMLGGAGNVARNLADLGCQVTFMGIIGNDETGRQISKRLSESGVKIRALKLENYLSTEKTRFLAGNNHLLRVDKEQTVPVVESSLPRFEKILRKAIESENTDIVLLSDYNKGLLTLSTTQLIIGLCKEYNRKVIVDPKGRNYEKYTGATLVKPNLKEFSEATGIKYNPTENDFHAKVQRGATDLLGKYNIQHLVVTLSEFGMLYVPSEDPENIIQLATEAKEVFDVSGAGDTALATLGAALGSGMSITDAMKLANTASGIVVGKIGTAGISKEELKEALLKRETSG